MLIAVDGFLKLTEPILDNTLNENTLSQTFIGMLKELSSNEHRHNEHRINNSRDALVSRINGIINEKCKSCPVFSELSVNENKTKQIIINKKNKTIRRTRAFGID